MKFTRELKKLIIYTQKYTQKIAHHGQELAKASEELLVYGKSMLNFASEASLKANINTFNAYFYETEDCWIQEATTPQGYTTTEAAQELIALFREEALKFNAKLFREEALKFNAKLFQAYFYEKDKNWIQEATTPQGYTTTEAAQELVDAWQKNKEVLHFRVSVSSKLLNLQARYHESNYNNDSPEIATLKALKAHYIDKKYYTSPEYYEAQKKLTNYYEEAKKSQKNIKNELKYDIQNKLVPLRGGLLNKLSGGLFKKSPAWVDIKVNNDENFSNLYQNCFDSDFNDPTYLQKLEKFFAVLATKAHCKIANKMIDINKFIDKSLKNYLDDDNKKTILIKDITICFDDDTTAENTSQIDAEQQLDFIKKLLAHPQKSEFLKYEIRDTAYTQNDASYIQHEHYKNALIQHLIILQINSKILAHADAAAYSEYMLKDHPDNLAKEYSVFDILAKKDIAEEFTYRYETGANTLEKALNDCHAAINTSKNQQYKQNFDKLSETEKAALGAYVETFTTYHYLRNDNPPSLNDFVAEAQLIADNDHDFSNVYKLYHQ